MARKITRRKAIEKTLAVTGGAIAAQAVGPFIARHALAQSKEQIVITSWGGSFQRAVREVYFEPFTKETGIEVVEHTYGTKGLAQLKAQQEAGAAQIDLLDGPPFWIGVGRKQGLTDTIDLSVIGDAGKHFPAAMNEWGYGWGTVAWGIAYNTNTFAGGAPSGWADFWDAANFKGRRSLFGPLVARHPEFALLADGVPPDQVNPLDDAKIDRAFKKLEEVKPHIDIWYQSVSQAETMLESGEVDMAEFVSGRAGAMPGRGLPIGFQFNGAVMNLLTWVLAKGAPNRKNAHTFLAFSSRPERQAAFAKKLYYGPTNNAAFDLIEDEAVERSLASHPDNLPKQVLLDGPWWGDNLGKLKSRWLELVST